jgi:hypothetical protein
MADSSWRALESAVASQAVTFRCWTGHYLGTLARLGARRRGKPIDRFLVDRHAIYEGSMRGAWFRLRELEAELDADHRAFLASIERAA